MSVTNQGTVHAPVFEFYPDNPGWSHQLNRVITESQGGGGDYGEILRVISKIKENDKESWHSAWFEMGKYVENLGLEAEKKGRLETARQSYLRASNYYRMAHFYLDGEDPRQLDTYHLYVSSFSRAASFTTEPKIEMIGIPFEGKKLHAYFARARDAHGKQPCLIIFGGTDSGIEELYFSMVGDAIDRSFSILAFDGPGQGYTRRFENLLARHDFEKPVGAAIDYLESNKREEVDLKKIGVLGRSFGGYYTARAAAKEHRVAAAVCFDGIYDVLSNVIDHGMHKRPGGNRMINSNLGVRTDEEARPKLAKFTLEGIAGEIKCPMLILHGKYDNLCSVEGAKKLYDSIKHDSKTLKIYESGHSMHIFKNEAQSFALDWLKETLSK